MSDANQSWLLEGKMRPWLVVRWCVYAPERCERETTLESSNPVVGTVVYGGYGIFGDCFSSFMLCREYLYLPTSQEVQGGSSFAVVQKKLNTNTFVFHIVKAMGSKTKRPFSNSSEAISPFVEVQKEMKLKGLEASPGSKNHVGVKENDVDVDIYSIEIERLRNNPAIVDTTPLKALSNHKFFKFCLLWLFREPFGNNNDGLLTGDFVVNKDAHILIMPMEYYTTCYLRAIKRISFGFQLEGQASPWIHLRLTYLRNRLCVEDHTEGRPSLQKPKRAKENPVSLKPS